MKRLNLLYLKKGVKKGILFHSCSQEYNQCSLDSRLMIIIQILVLYNHL